MVVAGVIGLKLADNKEETVEGRLKWVGFRILSAISEIVGVIGLKMYSKDKTLANGAIYIGGFATSFAFCILPSYFYK